MLPNGRFRLELRKPFYTGQTDIVFEPSHYDTCTYRRPSGLKKMFKLLFALPPKDWL